MDDTPLPDQSRRTVLAGVAGGVSVGLAGCVGFVDEEPAGDESGDDDESTDDDEHPFAEFVDHDGDEPIEFGDDQQCPVCAMSPTVSEPWMAQLAHENGSGAVFDTPGCLFAYVAEPATDSPIQNAWVTEYDGVDLIDATDAYFVLVTEESGITGDPMILNPRAFERESEAIAYLDEVEGESLTADDIIHLEDVTREEAEIYRANHLSMV